MVSGLTITVADLVPQNVLKGTALECKQAPFSNVHHAFFPRAAHWSASYCTLSRTEVDGAAALLLQRLYVEFIEDHDFAVKRMVVFGRREVSRPRGELPPERHLRVGPNNV
jgi:hypothetical protein